MSSAQEDIARNLRRSRELLQNSQRDVQYYEKEISTLEKQLACPHTGIKCGGVFGSWCKDCTYFFNDGF